MEPSASLAAPDWGSRSEEKGEAEGRIEGKHQGRGVRQRVVKGGSMAVRGALKGGQEHERIRRSVRGEANERIAAILAPVGENETQGGHREERDPIRGTSLSVTPKLRGGACRKFKKITKRGVPTT